MSFLTFIVFFVLVSFLTFIVLFALVSFLTFTGVKVLGNCIESLSLLLLRLGGQDAQSVTSNLIKLPVGRCLTVPLHRKL